MRGPYARRHAHVHRHTGERALEIRDFDAVETGNLRFLLHMRKKIVNAPYLLLSLLTSLNLCSGKFGQPITDDVRTLALLKQNIPSDYEIPVQYIPKEVAGRCWVVLNIYPLEQSLRKLSNIIGNSHAALPVPLPGWLLFASLYFDYINDVLNTASEETSSFSCKPPPCINSHTSPGSHEGGHAKSRTVLFLLLIPISACVVFLVWLVKTKRPPAACNSENNPVPPSDTISSVSTSVPLQTIAHHEATEEATPGHQSSSAEAHHSSLHTSTHSSAWAAEKGERVRERKREGERGGQERREIEISYHCPVLSAHMREEGMGDTLTLCFYSNNDFRRMCSDFCCGKPKARGRHYSPWLDCRHQGL
ncbi:hypothetical protein WMY93_013806 [Mugilogobius chulae]|uniref:Kit ligand n=1 Tax=Mugilogobius chulae TaxID=88201 RepID=A0AAW0P0L2_9GOBI